MDRGKEKREKEKERTRDGYRHVQRFQIVRMEFNVRHLVDALD